MDATTTSGLDALMSERPDLATLYTAMAERAWTTTGLDPVLLELCRLRIAQMHRCTDALAERTASALEAGLTEDLVSRLPHWPTDPDFAGVRRAALAVCEKLVMDVHSITDEETAAVTRELGDAGTVGLMLALGIFDGATRLRLILPATKGV